MRNMRDLLNGYMQRLKWIKMWPQRVIFVRAWETIREEKYLYNIKKTKTTLIETFKALQLFISKLWVTGVW